MYIICYRHLLCVHDRKTDSYPRRRRQQSSCARRRRQLRGMRLREHNTYICTYVKCVRITRSSSPRGPPYKPAVCIYVYRYEATRSRRYDLCSNTFANKWLRIRAHNVRHIIMHIYMRAPTAAGRRRRDSCSYIINVPAESVDGRLRIVNASQHARIISRAHTAHSHSHSRARTHTYTCYTRRRWRARVRARTSATLIILYKCRTTSERLASSGLTREESARRLISSRRSTICVTYIHCT